MAKMSLHQLPEDNAPQATPAALTPTEAKPDMSLAKQEGGLSTGLQGEITNKDLRLPRINLVHRTSQNELAAFATGSIVLDKSLELFKVGGHANLVVLSAKKMYQENTNYGEDMGEVVDTAAEVIAKGGSLVYGATNFWYERIDLLMAISKPDSVDDELLFPYSADLKGAPEDLFANPMCLAMMTLSKSAFNSMAKPIITAAVSTLRIGLERGVWRMTTRIKNGAKGSWPIPEVRMVGILPEEASASIKALLG
jgi:hypothetical protein